MKGNELNELFGDSYLKLMAISKFAFVQKDIY
jgi:hypothetical protein